MVSPLDTNKGGIASAICAAVRMLIQCMAAASASTSFCTTAWWEGPVGASQHGHRVGAAHPLLAAGGERQVAHGGADALVLDHAVVGARRKRVAAALDPLAVELPELLQAARPPATLGAPAILIRERLNIEGCFCWNPWGSEGESMIRNLSSGRGGL